jgi:hypothetical protein
VTLSWKNKERKKTNGLGGFPDKETGCNITRSACGLQRGPMPPSTTQAGPPRIPRFLLLKDVPSSFPFVPTKCREYSQFRFTEYHGCGPPSNDLGSPGDVYFDTQTKGDDLYGKLEHVWEKHTLQGPVIVHPYLPSYRLQRAPLPLECYWICFENFASETKSISIRTH